MAFHFVYRSVGTENRKARPDYYSKDGCLGSFLVALEAVRDCGDVIFLNDGPIPDHRRAAMSIGMVLTLPDVGNVASFRAAISLTDWRGWAEDDLVYLCEDDYLHLPRALSEVERAFAQIQTAAYLSAYRHEWFPIGGRETSARGGPSVFVDTQEWTPMWGTTLTFAARVAALRTDRILLAMSTRESWPRDIDFWPASQGYRGYSICRIVRSALYPSDMFIMRAAIRRIVRRERPVGLLMAPRPTLGAHVELGVMESRIDWATIDMAGRQRLG